MYSASRVASTLFLGLALGVAASAAKSASEFSCISYSCGFTGSCSSAIARCRCTGPQSSARCVPIHDNYSALDEE
jgi:hypothetical protein